VSFLIAIAALFLIPASATAVLPELSSTDVQRALGLVRQSREEAFLRSYVRQFPFRHPESVKSIQLETDFTRVVTRARIQKKLLNYYTQAQAERDYRTGDRQLLEIIARISVSPLTIAFPPAFPFSNYQITVLYEDPEGRAASRAYAGRQIRRTILCWGMQCYPPSPPRITGAALRVSLPFAEINPTGDLLVLVRKLSGQITVAQFNLAELI